MPLPQPSVLPTATTADTPKPTTAVPASLPTYGPTPIAGYVMDDSTIRTAVTAWVLDAAAAEATYGHISTWETGGVTDMSELFEDASSFNDDISAWDTSGVTTMNNMFQSAYAFNQPIGGWSVDKVTNMEFMFGWAQAFNQPLGDWNVDSVTNMYGMFYDARKFNQPLGEWDIGEVMTMGAMFYTASAFDQDLGWCVDDNVNLNSTFSSTPCESTSCGVTQVAGGCAPSPAPTSYDPTRAPTTVASTPRPNPTPTRTPTSYEPTPRPVAATDDDDDDNGDCTPGITKLECLDDGTLMHGNACENCDICELYDVTAATGGRYTCDADMNTWYYDEDLDGTPEQEGEFLECWYDDCSGDEEGGACDGIHLEPGWGEVCDSAHGETYGCPIVNTWAWESEFWSCDDLCAGTTFFGCNRAAYMSDDHCGSDVHEEYELSCDQNIAGLGLEHPSRVLCWCEVWHQDGDEDDHHYYEDEDDDDGGGSELVMSGGLVAIGLTFTGITVAAIANWAQEQCALGPTIVYAAGTAHPYYITPNLCTIGTNTYASSKTVHDDSPRKVCRQYCEEASEKLTLKHVQGLTCYCKRR